MTLPLWFGYNKNVSTRATLQILTTVPLRLITFGSAALYPHVIPASLDQSCYYYYKKEGSGILVGLTAVHCTLLCCQQCVDAVRKCFVTYAFSHHELPNYASISIAVPHQILNMCQISLKRSLVNILILENSLADWNIWFCDIGYHCRKRVSSLWNDIRYRFPVKRLDFLYICQKTAPFPRQVNVSFHARCQGEAALGSCDICPASSRPSRAL